MEIWNKIGRQNWRNYDVEIRKFEIEVSVELRWRNQITAERAKWILYFSTIEKDRNDRFNHWGQKKRSNSAVRVPGNGR